MSKRLTTPQLRRYRRLLLEKRFELVGSLRESEREANEDAGDISHVRTHLADLGSDTYERDVMRSLAESERRMLREIDAALERLDAGTFGICESTGEPIPRDRLEAVPWARYTIDAARRMEAETAE